MLLITMKRYCSPLMALQIAGGLCLALAIGPTARAGEAPPPAGLTLYLGFDQADAGGVVADKSDLKNKARVTDAKWTSSGRKAGGYELPAGGACIEVQNTTALNPKQGTVALWFKASKPDSAQRVILNKGRGRGYNLSIAGQPKEGEASGKLVATVNGRFQVTSDAAVADGGWHHAAMTCDGKEIKLYIDGQAQKTVTPCPEEMGSSGDPLIIGLPKSKGAQDKVQGLVGFVDEVMLFNRALSEEEVKGLTAVSSAGGPGRPRFTKQQVAGRLRQLKLLYEEGLLTESFYQDRVKECEVSE
jgi:hypothetical protein